MRISRLFAAASLITLLLTGTSAAQADSLVLGSSEFHYATGTGASTFNHFDGGWRAGTNAGEARLITTVRLPHGATVTAFTMYYLDNSSNLIECNLQRALITASEHPGSNALATTASTEQDTMDHSKTDVSISNALIDNGTYYYYVYVGMASGDGERIFLGAVIDYTAPVTAVGDQAPPAIGRASVRPNPFRAATSIQFSMLTDGPVSVDIYDLQGRLVHTIRNPYLPAGSHSLRWNGLDDYGHRAPSGVYFVHVKGQNEALAAKLVRIQ